MNNNKLNMSVLALGCGVLSIVIGLMGGFSASMCTMFTAGNTCASGAFGIIMQLVGVAAGVVGVFVSLTEQKTAAVTGNTSNLAAAAMVVSIIGIAVSFIGTVCIGICACRVNSAMNGLYSLSSYL